MKISQSAPVVDWEYNLREAILECFHALGNQKKARIVSRWEARHQELLIGYRRTSTPRIDLTQKSSNEGLVMTS
jgi:hypothetical protein